MQHPALLLDRQVSAAKGGDDDRAAGRHAVDLRGEDTARDAGVDRTAEDTRRGLEDDLVWEGFVGPRLEVWKCGWG